RTHLPRGARYDGAGAASGDAGKRNRRDRRETGNRDRPHGKGLRQAVITAACNLGPAKRFLHRNPQVPRLGALALLVVYLPLSLKIIQFHRMAKKTCKVWLRCIPSFS